MDKISSCWKELHPAGLDSSLREETAFLQMETALLILETAGGLMEE
jgi:hypothetical protein